MDARRRLERINESFGQNVLGGIRGVNFSVQNAFQNVVDQNVHQNVVGANAVEQNIKEVARPPSSRVLN